MQFDAAQTTTIIGTLTLTGTDCTTGRVFLDSITNDNPWDIDATGSVSINYVDVEDSNAVTALSAGNSTADAPTYNTGWTITAGACGAGTPSLDQLLRHGLWFNNGVKQPFTW